MDNPTFCPRCGNRLNGATVCPWCQMPVTGNNHPAASDGSVQSSVQSTRAAKTVFPSGVATNDAGGSATRGAKPHKAFAIPLATFFGSLVVYVFYVDALSSRGLVERVTTAPFFAGHALVAVVSLVAAWQKRGMAVNSPQTAKWMTCGIVAWLVAILVWATQVSHNPSHYRDAFGLHGAIARNSKA